jgi:hypothetical protein
MTPRRMLRWLSTAMLAAAPSLIKTIFNLEWSDPRVWGTFIFIFGFGVLVYTEGLLDGNDRQ